ncbi:hypothetical protein [Nocardioides sp. TF02-7]|uniref:hypothetical protein n=1 Tax=Nocardioides sp. TF02-7 TaxID=2917724 RepID=UPI001F070485|nr:hypothetical protein [Nocardioides sp. TF02-7]UMG94177.1 hypothetical protein MF408_09175 [Nocardioides sp. TF02-7]
MRHGASWLLAAALLLTGCSDAADPAPEPTPEAAPVVTAYDPTLEPAAAVLSLVPAEATYLEVTDFDQLRLTLGFGDGPSSEEERQRFWRAVDGAATFSRGMLRPAEVRLRELGIGQDDVVWEARWSGGAEGWVMALHERVRAGAVRRAVAQGVGVLDGARYDARRRLVLSTAPPDGAASWAAEPAVTGLVGQPANATYVERGCLAFDDVFGAGMEDRLAAAPRAELDALDPLGAYAVSFGPDLVTVRLGDARSDAFARLRIHELLPQTEPEFGRVFSRGVSDPSTGRLGYDVERPRAAVRLTTGRRLPFALCSD